MAGGAEGRPRHQGDAGMLDQVLGEFYVIGDARHRLDEALNLGEGVEGAVARQALGTIVWVDVSVKSGWFLAPLLAWCFCVVRWAPSA